MESSSTKFLLDSGDPAEYRKIAQLAKEQGSELWGATTNPSLIAKQLAGQKISQQEALKHQKEIVLEIISLLQGAVSAEVYADTTTSADEMIAQGREIAHWHRRVVVKLPTTIEGFKARSILRKEGIAVNNTLVFSQQQIFAICLHEQIMQQLYGPMTNIWPPFISPFVGRLDDRGENGIDLVAHGMKIKRLFHTPLPKSSLAIWMLQASVRSLEHFKKGLAVKSELITAPATVYEEWFRLMPDQRESLDEETYTETLQPIPYWMPPQELLAIQSEEAFFEAITSGKLHIQHELTNKGLQKFEQDWKAIIAT